MNGSVASFESSYVDHAQMFWTNMRFALQQVRSHFRLFSVS